VKLFTKKKVEILSRPFIQIQRGQIWLVQLDPTVGAEIRKTRPAVVVSEDSVGVLPLKIIAPITDWKEAYASRPWMVCIALSEENGLMKSSGVDTFQVRSISEQRLLKMLGTLSDTEMSQVSEALQLVLGLF
jgi:mRNA interferase MazF